MPAERPNDNAASAAAAASRAQLAADRAAQLRDRQRRLQAGQPITEHDLEEAQRALLVAVDRSEEAHRRAALAHDRAADAHLAAARALDSAGCPERAEAHRRAAAAEHAGNELEWDRAAQHHHDDRGPRSGVDTPD